jgi:hypothetical protein
MDDVELEQVYTQFGVGPIPKTLFYPQMGKVVRPLVRKPVIGKAYVWGQGVLFQKLSLLVDMPSSHWVLTKTHTEVGELIEYAYKSKGRYVTGTGSDPVFEVVVE